ncbi:MAG: ABC transporter ATP-binding protein, partial [Synergistaceae bacterium]|nr:ABC transporter ATP-binding protein [Synergistaceae bacterium]
AEDKLLGFSNLTPFKNRKAKDLSGGMKQKLGLACSLIHQPAVLLLDEPTNGVDPVSRRDFWKILHEMVKEGVTVFVSTSYLDEAERCERVGMMQEGRLTMCDNPRNLKKTISGSILEIMSDDPGKALEALKKRYGKMSSDIVSGIIRFRMPENSSPEKIEDEMKDMGVPPLSINEARPTLEDVFVSQALKAGPL